MRKFVKVFKEINMAEARGSIAESRSCHLIIRTHFFSIAEWNLVPSLVICFFISASVGWKNAEETIAVIAINSIAGFMCDRFGGYISKGKLTKNS
jgi:hypothetical protein